MTDLTNRCGDSPACCHMASMVGTLEARLAESVRRETKLTHAITMLENEVLSPKQRRRIIAEARSEYSVADTKKD